jgi:3-hydroxyisobutyrate dehydrogenase-like beta-hydroxyacid dehydrogenase
MAPPVGVIGLGLMGGTLASHLLERGPVVGFDPVAARRAEHEGRGGTTESSAAAVARACEAAILSLPNGEIMRSVCREIAGAEVAPLLVIDTTTVDPDESIEAAGVLAESGIGFVDATISGNAAQAESKDIIFMIGGEPDDVARALDVLAPLGRGVYPVGGVGTGSRMKLVVNHVLSINRAAVAEGLAVAEKAGIDLDAAIEILRDSAAYSKAMDIWGDRMVDGDHWPPSSRVHQSHKDSRLINAHAGRLEASSELAQVVRAALVEAEEGGLADADNSSVMEVMRRRAGIGRFSTTEAAARGDSAGE